MFVIWYDFATPRRTTMCCGRPVISLSWNQIRPALGFISPEINRKSVVFPAPFGPMIERSSPVYTVKSTRLTAMRLPKDRVSASVRSRTGPGIAGQLARAISACQG